MGVTKSAASRIGLECRPKEGDSPVDESGMISNKYTFEKELRLRQTLGLNKFCFSVGFHLTFAATELGFFSAGHVPVGTRDRRSGPMVSTQ